MNRFLTTAAVLALSTGVAQAEYTLNILHINDLHSRIESINRFDSTCDAEGEAEGACFGGVARLKTYIDGRRAELAGENLLVLDAGDQFQGSLMYTTYKGEVEAEMSNAIGFDVMAVGNHEFDDGPEALAKFADAADVPIISGNIDVSQSNVLAGKVEDHIILEVGGERIGIVSALATDTPETSSPGPNVIFTPEIEAMQADIDALTEMGVNKIIALTHLGIAADSRLAEGVTGLDLIIGGHSHTLMSNTEEDAMAYPTMVNGVPIVQAYAFSKYVGDLSIVFDDDGNVTSIEGDTVLMDA